MSDGAPPPTDDGDEEDESVADPFAELGEGVDSSVDEERERLDAHADDDLFSDDGNSDERTSRDAVSSDPVSDDDPFDQLGPTVGAESAADLDDAFEQMDVGGPAAEDVWESLDEHMSDAGTAVDTEGIRKGAASPGAAGPSDHGVEHLVNKRTYCQRCPHFSAPPNAACDHEGTTIVAVVGFDEFRVRNCPMVSEDDPTFDTDG